MKPGAIVIIMIILGAILAIAVMVKYATEIKVEDRYRTRDDPAKMLFKFTEHMGVITLNQNSSLEMAKRFPYVAAITRNHSYTWSFACFASVILVKWVVTSAHCRKTGSTHRVLLYHDFVKNYSYTYPILLWRLHELYDSSNPSSKYDIAVAKLNLEEAHPLSMKSSYIDEAATDGLEASVWKTVTTMDKRIFLTNAFESFDVQVVPNAKCLEAFGMTLDESLFCVDMSAHSEDYFINEFGPVYSRDKVVGVLAVKSRECDIKLAVFTNVSYFTNWILSSTHASAFG